MQSDAPRRFHELLAELAGALEAGDLVPDAERLAVNLRRVVTGEAALEDVLAPPSPTALRARRNRLVREYAARFARGDTVAERAREVIAAARRAARAGAGTDPRDRLARELVAAGGPPALRQTIRLLSGR